jgi:hypothetical protein
MVLERSLLPFFFWWDWGLNTGLMGCYVSTHSVMPGLLMLTRENVSFLLGKRISHWQCLWLLSFFLHVKSLAVLWHEFGIWKEWSIKSIQVLSFIYDGLWLPPSPFGYSAPTKQNLLLSLPVHHWIAGPLVLTDVSKLLNKVRWQGIRTSVQKHPFLQLFPSGWLS